MLLSPDDARQYFRLHRGLMHFVNQRLRVAPACASPEEFSTLPAETRLEVRKALLDRIELIEIFAAEHRATLDDEDREIVLSWRDLVFGSFYVFRQLKRHMVFLSAENPPVAYGVLALTEPFEKLIGPHLPVMTEATLMPLKDGIVYDGLLTSYSISFGGGIKRMLNDSYRRAKDRLGIVTSLPIQSIPISSGGAENPRPPKKANRPGATVPAALQAVLGITDGFCRDHLNEEYAEMCGKLAEKIARKRPSPLTRGKSETWAVAIIRTIGWVNFLEDRSNPPCMAMAEINKRLGVAASTGKAKSTEIRKMFGMCPGDPDWTLPSRLNDNPMAWMLQIDGLIRDIREEPRELQEIAFAKKLIPYIPADRKAILAKRDGGRSAKASSGRLFQFRIALLESDPAIWRRVQVVDCTLDDLHRQIQAAMGWSDSHPYDFEIDESFYGNPAWLGDGSDFDSEDSTSTLISDILPADGRPFRFLYEYDFGDSWEHDVLYEGCPPVDPAERYPVCLEGERACPPEESGGIWGYQECLEIIAKPGHHDYEGLLEWRGPLDPDKFDAEEATRRMRQQERRLSTDSRRVKTPHPPDPNLKP